MITVVTMLNGLGKAVAFPRQRSPWTYPPIKKHVKRKLDYVDRQITILRRWLLETREQIFLEQIQAWTVKREQIENVKL